MLKNGCINACPGCSHRSLTMEESLYQKEQWLKKMLLPWQELIQPIKSESGEDRWSYRGKVCLSTRFLNGEWQFGMFRRDELIDIDTCPIHTNLILNSIRLLKKILPKSVAFPMAFYYHTEAQLTLILKSKEIPDLSWLTDDIQEEFSKIGVEGLSIHLNPSAGRRLFEKKGWHLLWGKDKSVDQLGFIYGRTSFHQLIPGLYLPSVDEAEFFLQPDESVGMVDLYCGRGITLNKWVTRHAHTIGIESSGEAVSCAKINVPGALIFQGTCERRIPQLEEWKIQLQTIWNINRFGLYTNPPRTGMEQLVTNWITSSLKPFRIAYLSCSAGTLRRDLEILINNGYKVCSIIPYDFFPQTYHIECLVFIQAKFR
jgi:23S rRNA (uracil1939-C5)-methyltransferase